MKKDDALSSHAYFALNNGKKINLHGKKIVLPIGIGQSYHKNESFSTTIDLINQYQPKQCDILLADTLQRHTLQINERDLDPKEAYEKSILLGNLWLSRNQKYIEKLHAHTMFFIGIIGFFQTNIFNVDCLLMT